MTRKSRRIHGLHVQPPDDQWHVYTTNSYVYTCIHVCECVLYGIYTCRCTRCRECRVYDLPTYLPTVAGGHIFPSIFIHSTSQREAITLEAVWLSACWTYHVHPTGITTHRRYTYHTHTYQHIDTRHNYLASMLSKVLHIPRLTWI